jgi:protein-arginine kinase activator protein McsA
MTTRQPWERPWDPPGLPFRADDQRCANHQSQCAFRDDDPTRCPWCHVTLKHLELQGHSGCLHAQRVRTKELKRARKRGKR